MAQIVGDTGAHCIYSITISIYLTKQLNLQVGAQGLKHTATLASPAIIWKSRLSPQALYLPSHSTTLAAAMPSTLPNYPILSTFLAHNLSKPTDVYSSCQNTITLRPCLYAMATGRRASHFGGSNLHSSTLRSMISDSLFRPLALSALSAKCPPETRWCCS